MYVENTILTAVMEEDYDKAREILSDFYPGELRELYGHLETLLDILDKELESRD